MCLCAEACEEPRKRSSYVAAVPWVIPLDQLRGLAACTGPNPNTNYAYHPPNCGSLPRAFVLYPDRPADDVHALAALAPFRGEALGPRTPIRI